MIALALPVVVACLAAIAVLGVARGARPHVAVPVLTATVAATTIAVAGGLALLALVLLFDPHSTAWCEEFLGHGDHRALAPGGLAAAACALVVLRGVTSLLRHRTMLTGRRPDRAAPVEVVAGARVVAYARPGRPGRVVVSRAMLDALSGEERLVLLAHERAHLRHAHHRYIAVADACAAAVPLLRPLAGHVRFACERWADEEAASVVGERRLVARAVAVAALAQAEASPAVAFGGTGGIPARVEAMLAPARPPRATLLLAAAAPALVAVAAAALQAQRLAEVLRLVV